VPTLKPKTPEQREWLKGRNKYPSGYCNSYNKDAQHEGTKPKNVRGMPLKTCPMWQTCPCECHYNLDTLFASVGKTREEEVPNPEYMTPKAEFRMPAVPDPIEHAPAVSEDGVTSPPDLEHPLGAASSQSTAPLASRRTPTGRAARGGLEAQVWEACRRWADMPSHAHILCTPKLTAEDIAEKYKIPTPSSGAIAAVWDRWEKLGFAEQAKKPLRFTGFTGNSSWEHLQRMKSTRRTVKKAAESAARRGFR
jgi:hypothetical protein